MGTGSSLSYFLLSFPVMILNSSKRFLLMPAESGDVRSQQHLLHFAQKKLLYELTSNCCAWCHFTALTFSLQLYQTEIHINHKNFNFLECDWFKKVLFSTNSLAKLSVIGQFNKLITFKPLRSSDFVITRMITDRIGLHSVLLLLHISIIQLLD